MCKSWANPIFLGPVFQNNPWSIHLYSLPGVFSRERKSAFWHCFENLEFLSLLSSSATNFFCPPHLSYLGRMSIKASLSNVNLAKKRLGNAFCSLERGCIIPRCPLLCQELKMLHEPHLGRDEWDPPFERLRPVEHPFHHYSIGASRINHLFPQVESPFVKTLGKLNFSKYMPDGTEEVFSFPLEPHSQEQTSMFKLKNQRQQGFQFRGRKMRWAWDSVKIRHSPESWRNLWNSLSPGPAF